MSQEKNIVHVDRELLGEMIETRALAACQKFDKQVHKPRYEEQRRRIEAVEEGLANAGEALKTINTFIDRMKGGWIVLGFLWALLIVVVNHYWKVK